MGQTLTHGVYLPDEGERNCYSGLAANWSILDGAVGTVAEHTAALSGKAPLVHTHGKSDITDLFNSANTWTGANTFSKALTVEKSSDTDFFFKTKHTAAELGSLPSSDQSITWAFKDKNDDNLCYARVYYETTGGNSLRIFVRNKYASGAPSTSGTVDYAYFGLKINADKSKEGVLRGTFRPYDNNTYDLGTSSYQWKTLNGINPGALSFPDYNRFEPIDFSKWDVNLGWDNLYTPSEDGWLYAEINDAATNSIYLYSSGLQPVQSVNRKYGISAQGNGSQSGYGGRLAIMIPVRKDIQYRFLIKASTVSDIYAVTFYPCLGNV